MKKGLVICCLVGLVVVAGCVSSKITRSGFLKNYDDFTGSKQNPGMLMDNRNLAKLNDYNKYIIDPVVIDFENKNKKDPVPQDVQQEVAAFLRDEVVKGLQDKYQIVDTPGPGVLRIRLAITDIEARKPYLNAASLIKLAEAGVSGASMEVELVDSVTGEPIAAAIDYRKASEWDISNGLIEWGFAKDVCADWAKMFRERLDSGYKDIAVNNAVNAVATTVEITTSPVSDNSAVANLNTN